MSRPAKNEASKSIDKVPRPMRRIAVKMNAMTGWEGVHELKSVFPRSSLHLEFISFGYSPFSWTEWNPVRLQ